MKKEVNNGLKLKIIISQLLYTNAFELFIFDTKKNMLNGIKKWLKENKAELNIEFNSAIGITIENMKYPIINENDEEYKIFGAMFLCEEFLDIDLLAHECLHMAFLLEKNIYRFIGQYNVDNSGNSSEERLTYSMSEFIKNILKQCIKNKIKIELVKDMICK